MADIKSASFMEMENQEAIKNKKEQIEKIGRITLEIEQILIRENLTIEEWGNIVENFNRRNNYVIPRLTVLEVKERFENKN